MSEISKTQIATETEIGGDGIGRSEAGKRGGVKASPSDLTAALVASQETIDVLNKANSDKDLEIASLKAQLANQSQNSESDISKLAHLIAGIVQNNNNNKPTQNSDIDNINRVTDFKNTRATVDGTSMQEAQQLVQEFRTEKKLPISIPKSFANTIGPSLDITVNGVRVSIPCDGRTHFINETHYEHARERIAKIDLLNGQNDQEVIIG